MIKLLIIATNDPFSGIGGSETAYKNLRTYANNIEITVLTKQGTKCLDDDKVQYLFYDDHDVPIKKLQKKLTKEQLTTLPSLSLLHGYMLGQSIGKSLQNKSFDIIEIQDFYHGLVFLKIILEQYHVTYDKIVLALHGSIKQSMGYRWNDKLILNDRSRKAIEFCDQVLFNAADVRYAISDFYIDALQKQQKEHYHKELPIQKLSEFAFLKIPNPHQLTAFGSNTLPNISFIGRFEKRKGPDTCLNLLNFIPKETYKDCFFIGTDLKERAKEPFVSEYILSMANRRSIEIAKIQSLNYEELFEFYQSSPQVGLLPVRYDSFNLVAMELFLHGHPVVIGKNSGVYHYLKDKLKVNFAFHGIDTKNYFQSENALKDLLVNYHSIRRQIIDYLKDNYTTFLDEQKNVDLFRIYQTPKCNNFDEIRPLLMQEYEACKKFEYCLNSSLFDLIYKISAPIRKGLQRYLIDPIKFFRNRKKINYEKLKNNSQFLKKTYETNPFLKPFFLKNIFLNSHLRSPDISVQIVYLCRLLRLNYWEGQLVFQQISQLKNDPKLAKIHKELDLLRDIVENKSSENKIYSHLQSIYLSLKDKPQYSPHEQLILKNPSNSLKVSIIVSLYNVEIEEIEFFISHASHYHMLKERNAEIIFIESGSKNSLISHLETHPKLQNVCYSIIRTSERETIQKAWNRGCLLAKGEYLVFLGVDEGLRFDALNLLADYLDSHPDVNWVMSDSIMQELDKDFDYVKDLMFFQRAPLNAANILFDCTYLTYVGGMYRKNLHDYGYYDPSFMGAGDTEFKCRLFPYIKAGHIPIQLGFLYNFDKPRVTENHLVEIEDLRAWYVFRTPGGIKYLFEFMDETQLENIFLGMLQNRRAFSEENESDLFFAYNTLKYIIQRFPENSCKVYLPLLESLVKKLSSLTQANEFHEIEPIKTSLIEQLSTLQINIIKTSKLKEYSTSIERDAFFFAHGWILKQHEIDSKAQSQEFT